MLLVIASLALMLVACSAPEEDPGATSTAGLTFKLNSDKESYTLTGVEEGFAAEHVVIGSYAGLPVKSIATSALEGCESIKTVTIDSKVRSIGEAAFAGCTALESVTVGSGVLSIGKRAFGDCDALNSVTFKSASGWGYTELNVPDASLATAIPSTLVADAEDAAELLTYTYVDYFWVRSN